MKNENDNYKASTLRSIIIYIVSFSVSYLVTFPIWLYILKHL